MLSHFLESSIPVIIHLLEAMGVFIIFVGAIKAFGKYFCNLVKRTNYPIKSKFAESLTLSASDIVISIAELLAVVVIWAIVSFAT